MVIFGHESTTHVHGGMIKVKDKEGKTKTTKPIAKRRKASTRPKALMGGKHTAAHVMISTDRSNSNVNAHCIGLSAYAVNEGISLYWLKVFGAVPAKYLPKHLRQTGQTYYILIAPEYRTNPRYLEALLARMKMVQDLRQGVRNDLTPSHLLVNPRNRVEWMREMASSGPD